MIFLLGACASPSPAPPLDVLVVSMDTIRYDRTSLGGSRDTTPNLAALARIGTSFRSAYAVGNESLYSHASIFTGCYPSEVAVPDYSSFAIPDGVPTLAGVLSAYGYATAAFTGGGHIIADFGFNKGFGLFQSAKGGTRFASLFDSVPPALVWMREHQEKPWFVFVHGYDAHTPDMQRGPFLHPWRPDGVTPRVESLAGDPLAIEQLRGNKWFPERTPGDFVHAAGRRILATDFYTLPAEPMPGERVETLTDGEMLHLRDHYDSGLLYADFWLGQLLSQVDFSHTLVIVLSDHGEDVMDHGYMNHRAGLWDSTLHVPLVVAGPGFGSGVQRDELVDLRSVLPTVLHAVGAVMPAGVSAAPLQSPGRSSYVFAEGVMDMVSVRGGEGRLSIRDAHLASGGIDFAALPLDDPRVSFLENASDRPVPMGPRFRNSAENLRRALVGWRSSLVRATEPGEEIPEALREEFRKHGYWTPEDTP